MIPIRRIFARHVLISHYFVPPLARTWCLGVRRTVTHLLKMCVWTIESYAIQFIALLFFSHHPLSKCAFPLPLCVLCLGLDNFGRYLGAITMAGSKVYTRRAFNPELAQAKLLLVTVFLIHLPPSMSETILLQKPRNQKLVTYSHHHHHHTQRNSMSFWSTLTSTSLSLCSPVSLNLSSSSSSVSFLTFRSKFLGTYTGGRAFLFLNLSSSL